MIINDFQDNYGTGWIKLYRSIKDHWIWQDPIKFQWWIDILISVNHSGKTINIGYDIFDCKPGQSIRSLKNWADNWNVSKDTVRNFFTLLKKDKMILTENLKKTTRLTVCNYDTYQSNLHDKQTQGKRKANDKQTQGYPNKNDKKEKNDKNNISLDFYQNQIVSLNGVKFSKEYQMIFDYISGKNDLERPLDEILQFPDQLTYKQFEKLFEKSKKKEFSFKETLMTITNKKDYWYKKTSLYLTLNGWINRSKDKK
jgi:hypothetical protein